YSAIRKIDKHEWVLHTKLDSSIAILKLFPGISEQVVRSVFSNSSLKAVILETYGSGNAPTIPWLIDALQQAIDRGVIIVNVSQCPGGMVVQGKYETSKELMRAGVLSGADMTTEAALTKLMVLLGNYDKETCKRSFEQNLAGELSS